MSDQGFSSKNTSARREQWQQHAVHPQLSVGQWALNAAKAAVAVVAALWAVAAAVFVVHRPKGIKKLHDFFQNAAARWGVGGGAVAATAAGTAWLNAQDRAEQRAHAEDMLAVLPQPAITDAELTALRAAEKSPRSRTESASLVR